tara:strand:+ start:1380 stop:1982 length:603 start_codon:yes stop_codon:yes gene_type:complete
MEFLLTISTQVEANIDITLQDLSKTIIKGYTFDELLLKAICEKTEGKCNPKGIVLKGTTRIISRDIGRFVSESFTGIPRYSIKYSVNILNPSRGIIIPCYIKIQKKVGLMASYDVKDKTLLILLIPFQLADRGVNNIDQRKMILEAAKNPKQQIYVQVVQSIFEIKDQYITVLGNITSKQDFLNQNKPQDIQNNIIQIVG